MTCMERSDQNVQNNKNIVWQQMTITRKKRAESLQQVPKTIWLTGLSGSGKSTLINEMDKRLFEQRKKTMVLDGDNVRMGLNGDLGFRKEDREENIRRVAEVAKLMNDAGIIVLTSFISPFEADRQKAREIIGEESFIEIYVSTPLEECEKRDVKGLYKKARQGKITDFSGISSPYEVPRNADIVIDTSGKKIEDCVDEIMEQLSAIMDKNKR